MITHPEQTVENRLNDRHYFELIERRGLQKDWVEANCYSISKEEASLRLGYQAKSDGIWIQGDGIQGQFKPDKPWRSSGDKKAPKYRSPMNFDHSYDAIAPKHPTNQIFWTSDELRKYCYQIDGIPIILLTEAALKAIAPTAVGIPTLGLLGVSQGLTSKKQDIQSKRYLIPILESYAKQGFGFCLGFDADCATNTNVSWEQLKLANQLKLFGCPVFSITGLWSVEEGKGIDDFIQKNGANKFRDIMSRAQKIEDWEKQFKESLPSDKTPTPRKLGLEIAEKYQSCWRFHNEQKTWRKWTGKCWEAVEEEAFAYFVFNEIESRNIDYPTNKYVENVAKTLKLKLFSEAWETWDRKRFIPFNNCVVDIETGEVHEHCPGMRFLSFIPRDWCILENLNGSDALGSLNQYCPHTFKYLSSAMRDDPSKVLKLLAIINGIIKWRFHDLQMFIHLVGEPGAGKGVFIRLLQNIIGKSNFSAATLTKLDDDYTIASVIDKQLVICPDEDRKSSGFGGLKALTGGDSISYRQIYKKPASSPFYGSLIVVSNRAIFAGDTTGLERRLCLVNFDRRVPDIERNSRIEDALQEELGALTAIALSMPDNLVTELIRGIGSADVPEFRSASWQLTLDTNSVALHLDECLVNDADAQIEVASLYEDYREFCQNSGVSPMAKQRYSQELVAITNHRLGWVGIDHARAIVQGSRKRVIKGIRFRTSSDNDIPTPSESFSSGTAGTARDSTGTALKTELSPYEHKGFSDLGQHFDDLQEHRPIIITNPVVTNDAVQNIEKTTVPTVPLEPQGFQPSQLLSTSCPGAVPVENSVPSAVPSKPVLPDKELLDESNALIHDLMDKGVAHREISEIIKRKWNRENRIKMSNLELSELISELKFMSGDYPSLGGSKENQRKAIESIAAKIAKINSQADWRELLKANKHIKDQIKWVLWRHVEPRVRTRVMPFIWGDASQLCLDLSSH
ncbi:DUF3854 domain-containing protein [Oscillatoria acuminata]|uniref:Putative ATPase n=1 Tax=Oscillatoria acuminata PCC 6304 TaxID=56110 RepID=K9TK19_9CYAN|nr:DUF3854 domain-containing protein [Oscillatoria acuminata]AFY82880.1 putative ATPase [Oscillatoria acuminata PCC 6304]